MENKEENKEEYTISINPVIIGIVLGLLYLIFTGIK